MSLTRSRTLIAGSMLSALVLTGAVSCSKNDTTQTAPPATSATTTTTASTSTTEAPTTTSSSTGASTSTTAAGSEATTTTGPTSAADLQAAQAALITANDVPAGFTEAPSSSSSSSNPYASVPECAPYLQTMTTTDAQRTAKAKVTFKNASKDEIEDSVEVYPSADITKTLAATATDPGFTSCLQAAFTTLASTGLPAGSSLGTVTVVPATGLPSASALGVDSASAILFDIPLTVQGQTVDLHLGVVLLTAGRTTASVSLQSTGSTFDASSTIVAAAAKLKANAPA